MWRNERHNNGQSTGVIPTSWSLTLGLPSAKILLRLAPMTMSPPRIGTMSATA